MIQINRTHGAVLYTRVSTGEQEKHGTSPETQRNACRQKALALSLPIIAEYHDGGISGGFLLARPGMQAALADIRDGRADTLICPNLSRYSRDVEHQQAVKKAVKAAGGQLMFCDMNFEDTPEGDLSFDIQGTFAAYERKAIRARCMKGRRARAEGGQQPARTTPPLGYHVVTKADVLRGNYPAEQIGRYFAVEPAASLARTLFGWYAGGQSLADISKRLHADGTPPVRGGTIWHPSAISNILTNPVYKGQAIFGRVEKHMEEGRIGQPHPVTGRPMKQPYKQKMAPLKNQVIIPCPALVTEAVWDKVQQRLVSGRPTGSGNPRRVRMLAGRVHCPNCGGAMIYQPQKKSSKNPAILIPSNYTCYQHSQAKRLQDDLFCDAKTYRVSIVEGAVVQAILNAASSRASIKAAMQEYQGARNGTPSAQAADPKRELAAIHKALEQLEAQQAATVQAQVAGIMAGASPNAYAEAFAALAARRKDLEQRRGELKQQTVPRATQKSLRMEQPAALLEKAYAVLTSPEVPEAKKRDMVGSLIESVTCHKDGARIEFLPGLFGLDGDMGSTDGEETKTLQTVKMVCRVSFQISSSYLRTSITAHQLPVGECVWTVQEV